MVFTFFGVMASRTPRDSVRAVPRTASSSFSSDSHGSPAALVAGAAAAAAVSSSSASSSVAGAAHSDALDEKDAKDARLAVDIGQLMRKDSNYSPKDIADFLHQLPHLDPKMVGRVLGEPDELALSVLQEYANGFDFKGFSFDVALRVYLGRFVLPGEAQKIDRILQAFARAYFAANPRDTVCSSEDAVYTLAFSAVLLNTDAHNPHLAKKYKMGKDDFIRNHQRIRVDGRHMPRDFLARCYDSFASYPIQLLPRKPAALLRDELELTFADGPLGLDIETSIDGRTCVVKRYATPHRHIYCTRGTDTAQGSSGSSSTDDDDDHGEMPMVTSTFAATAPSATRPLPDLAGYVVVAVADDCTRAIGYDLTRYLLKTAARPVTVRFCEPSVYFESIA